MHRLGLSFVTALVLVACRKDTGTTSPVEVVTTQIADGDATVQLDVGYRALPEREVELVASLSAVGIVESEKLVVDVLVDGFVLVAGEPQWAGFVAPRQPIKHRTSFRMLDGHDAGALTLTVQRSRNSEVLFERRIEFTAEGDRVQAVADEVEVVE